MNQGAHIEAPSSALDNRQDPLLRCAFLFPERGTVSRSITESTTASPGARNSCRLNIRTSDAHFYQPSPERSLQAAETSIFTSSLACSIRKGARHSCRLNIRFHQWLGRNAAFRLQQRSAIRRYEPRTTDKKLTFCHIISLKVTCFAQKFQESGQKETVQPSPCNPLLHHSTTPLPLLHHPSSSGVQAITGYYRLLQAITAYFSIFFGGGGIFYPQSSILNPLSGFSRCNLPSILTL